MTLNYTQIFDEILKSKFKELVQSGHATGGVALAALKEQLDRGAAFQDSFSQHNGFWSHVGQMLSKEPIQTIKGAGKIAGNVAGAYGAGG